MQRFLTDAALDSCPMCRGPLSPTADLCQRYAMERARADYLEREVRQLRDLSEQHANRLHRLYCRDVDATFDLVRNETATTHKSVWQFLSDAADEVTFSDACNDFVTDVRYMSRVPSPHEMRMIVRRAAR